MDTGTRRTLHRNLQSHSELHPPQWSSFSLGLIFRGVSCPPWGLVVKRRDSREWCTIIKKMARSRGNEERLERSCYCVGCNRIKLLLLAVWSVPRAPNRYALCVFLSRLQPGSLSATTESHRGDLRLQIHLRRLDSYSSHAQARSANMTPW